MASIALMLVLLLCFLIGIKLTCNRRVYACLDGDLTDPQLWDFLANMDRIMARCLARYDYVNQWGDLGVQEGLDIVDLDCTMVSSEETFGEVLGHFVVRLEVPAGDEQGLQDFQAIEGFLAVDEDFDVVLGYCLDNAR